MREDLMAPGEAVANPPNDDAAKRAKKKNFDLVWYIGLGVSLLVGVVCVGILVAVPPRSLSTGALVFLGGFLGGALSSVLELIRTSRIKEPTRPIKLYVLNLVAAPIIGGLLAGAAVIFGFVTEAGKIKLPGVTLTAVNKSGYAGLGASVGFYAQTIIASVVPGFFKGTRRS
jgi:hypothetical protein